MSTLTTFDKSITYDRETKDFRAELNGNLVGFFGSFHAAEIELDRVAYELASDPPADGGGDDCPDHGPYGDDDCPKCETCLGEGRIPAYGTGDQAGGYAETCPDCTPLRAPTVFCPLCLCVVDHVDPAAWLCRNDRCLARYPNTDQLLTMSELLERRRIAIDLASGVCPNCGSDHHIQSCPEIRQAIDGGDHRLALGRTLCRLRWRNYARFVVLISHIPAWQIGMYAESYVAYIQSYSPRPTNLTTADVLKAWAKLIHPDGPAAPVLRLAA